MGWNEIAHTLLIWGPGGALAAIVIILLYRLVDKIVDKLIPPFIEAQRAQATSLAKLAAATEGLKDCMTDAARMDNAEHREMIILLKVIKDRLRDRTEE